MANLVVIRFLGQIVFLWHSEKSCQHIVKGEVLLATGLDCFSLAFWKNLSAYC